MRKTGRKFIQVFLGASVFAMLNTASAADRIAKAIFVDPPKDAPEKIYLISADKTGIEVELPSRNFSSDIVLPKGDLVLAILPSLPSEDQKIPSGAPTVSIPKEWSRTYLVFAFSKENKVFPMEAFPIDGSFSRFSLGHSRIINLSPAVIKGQFGDKIVTVRPRQIEDLSPPRNDFGPYPVNVDFMMKGDETSTPLMRSKWQHNPRARQIMLITKPATAKYPRIRGIEDRVPLKEE